MKIKKYDFEYDPFGRAFVENRDKPTIEQIAYGLLESAKYRPITFNKNCLLPTVEEFGPEFGSSYCMDSGISYFEGVYDKLAEDHPEHADDIMELKENMRRANTAYRSDYESLTPYERMLFDCRVCYGGRWIGHANPDYDRVLHLGTDGIRALIEECRVKNPGKDHFYNACKISMDAVDVVGDRICDIACKNAENEQDEKERAEWLRIAEDFRVIPRKPAFDIHSAVMMFWVFFTFDGIDSPGRLDQFMYDYYKVSTDEENYDMITRLLEAIHNVRAWNLCISGSDENWNDQTNDLSYLILRRVADMKYQTPNLTMRVHRNTPEKLWKMAAECIGTGTGLPAIYNDEVVCPALEAIGIPDYDSHNYCMNGCNQIDIMGKSHMGLEDGGVSMAKVLELTLHDGSELSTGKPRVISRRFGDPRECETFEDFLVLYYKNLDYITDMVVKISNRFQEMYSDFAPSPVRSCTIQGCLEKGRDYKNGGPLYGHGQLLLQGIADTADSLWAIKTMVYDEKKYTMDELVEALEDNFEGHDTLWKDFSSCDKFGNDLEGVDTLCGKIVDHIFKYFKTKETYRGGIYTGGCSPYEDAANYGLGAAALPNGKKRGESRFADSVAATPGNDVKGPTASIKSMMHYNQKEACSGFVSQMKMSKSTFCTEKGMETFITMAKVYFAGGGQTLAVNVVDRATLLAARKEPEKYKNLVVRVGGYSDYFNNLTPALQQNVIDRSEFAL